LKGRTYLSLEGKLLLIVILLHSSDIIIILTALNNRSGIFGVIGIHILHRESFLS